MPGGTSAGDDEARFAGVRLTVGRVEVALALAIVVMIVAYHLSGDGLGGLLAALLVLPAAAVAVLAIWWLVRGPGRHRSGA
jgi:hypothetical protein